MMAEASTGDTGRKSSPVSFSAKSFKKTLFLNIHQKKHLMVLYYEKVVLRFNLQRTKWIIFV